MQLFKNRETLLIFNEQTSDIYEINANILQKFFISSILFLFFNASLIERCKALKIKIEVFNFVNDINMFTINSLKKSVKH